MSSQRGTPLGDHTTGRGRGDVTGVTRTEKLGSPLAIQVPGSNRGADALILGAAVGLTSARLTVTVRRFILERQVTKG
jgi:hypothetical protein